MGSPSLLASQGPPKPCQSVLPAAGPKSTAPVALSKTANDVLTHCTYCVAPTAPLVSGGALVTLNPGRPTPTPSKLIPAVVPTSGVGPVWPSGSAWPSGRAGWPCAHLRTGCSQRSSSGGMILTLWRSTTSWLSISKSCTSWRVDDWVDDCADAKGTAAIMRTPQSRAD